jgi:hypothetical protein
MNINKDQKEAYSAIIKQLASAPESQLSERLRKMCEDWDGSTEQMEDIFRSIYFGCCESSSFYKAVVDPKFTGWEVKPDEGPRIHNHVISPAIKSAAAPINTTEKPTRIKHVGPKAKKVSAEEVAKALGAEIIHPSESKLPWIRRLFGFGKK